MSGTDMLLIRKIVFPFRWVNSDFTPILAFPRRGGRDFDT